MKIYTKTGDGGETSLFGGDRVNKDNQRIEAYGTVDELNALIGVAAAETKNEEIKKTLLKIQHSLFVVGSDLATPFDKEKKVTIQRVDESFAKVLEEKIDYFDSKIPELKSFILPGGTKASSILHLARTVCRRAERRVVSLQKSVDIGNAVIVYLNRLSDLLFVLARYENFISNIPDVNWEKEK